MKQTRNSRARAVALGLFALSLGSAPAWPAHAAAPPELASWKLNLTGATGYGGLPANVQQVRYSTGSVYINCSSIPSYSIGPWPMNPNTPTNQNFLLRIPRTPVENTGAKTSTPLGPVGSWTNGVAARVSETEAEAVASSAPAALIQKWCARLMTRSSSFTA